MSKVKIKNGNVMRLSDYNLGQLILICNWVKDNTETNHREQAEEELMDMLQSNRLFKMKDTTLDFIKKLTGQSGNSYTIRETGKFLSNLINELKIQYEIKE